jgi:hypothetical protein
MARRRYKSRGGARAQERLDFINPWPNLPSTDARVMIRLNQMRVPYSYRYFNADNPYIKTLLPGWAPEFTLKDYKLVILVVGSFFGNIPSVISQNALATVILQQEGWKVLTWHEVDIVSRLDWLFAQEPKLRNPVKLGPPYKNPFEASLPNIMEQFRRMRAMRKVTVSARQKVETRGTGSRRHTPKRSAFVTGVRYRDYRLEKSGTRRRRAQRSR